MINILRQPKIIRWVFNKIYKLHPPEFVQYWKTGDLARAKLTTLESGAYGMVIEGEKYPLMGFPRGAVLFGPLARLKHLAKNLIFNDTWKLLEEGKTNKEIMAYLKGIALPKILDEVEKSRYDMFPPEKLCPSVKELWRAMDVTGKKLEIDGWFNIFRDGVAFFFQEDDAYRFRLQWVAKYINPKSVWRRAYRFFTGKPYSFRKELELILNFLGDAEIVPDMKGRIKLIKRVLLAFLEDKDFGKLIEEIIWELDWKKLKLSKADTYYFRGKYFKVDHDHYDY